jgi:hypothetical protein
MWDIAPMGHATCMRERAKGFTGVQPNPEGGCVYWLRDPSAPVVNTRAEWIALHGPGLTGFTERSERKFRPSMTAHDVRRAVASGDAEAIAWEVARLHDTLRRTVDALYSMLARIELEQFRDDITQLRELLACEPAVRTHLQRHGQRHPSTAPSSRAS